MMRYLVVVMGGLLSLALDNKILQLLYMRQIKAESNIMILTAAKQMYKY